MTEGAIYAGLDIDEQIFAHLATPGGATFARTLELDALETETAQDALLAWLEYDSAYGSQIPPGVLADEVGWEGDLPEAVGEPGYWANLARMRQLKQDGGAALTKAGKIGRESPVAAFEYIRAEADRLLQRAQPDAAAAQSLGVAGVTEWYKRQLEAGATGLTLGFPMLDKAVGSLRPGEMTVIVARLKRYKSWLAQKSAVETMRNGLRVTFAPLELPDGEFKLRVACMLGGIPWSKAGVRMLSREELDRLEEVEHWLREQPNPIHIVKPRNGHCNAATLVKAAVENGSDVLYVDQLDFMDRRPDQQDWLEFGRNAQELKEAAMEHDIPVVLCHQLNKTGVVKKFVDLGAEMVGRADKVGQACDLLLASFATGRMKDQKIIHYGVLESRSCVSPRAWEVKVDLDEAADFHMVGEHDLSSDDDGDD